MKHTVDAMGKQCPIPVVMTKKILDKAEQGDEILILVDNETAVNNLSSKQLKQTCRKYRMQLRIQKNRRWLRDQYDSKI